MRGTSKPPSGCTIQHGHPLAQGLVAAFVINETGGPIRDLVTGNVLGFNGAGARANSRVGESLDCQGNDAGVTGTAWQLLKNIQGNEISLLWRGIMLASPAAFSMFGGVTYTTSDSDPFQAYSLEHNNDGTKYRLSWNSGGSSNNLEASPGSAFDGTERQVVGVIRGGTVANGCKIMEGPNAAVLNTGTANAGPNFSSSRIGIGVYQPSIGRNSKTLCRHFYIYNRTIEQCMAQQLWIEPYAFLQIPRKYIGLVISPPPVTTVFRRSLSELGTRVGTRQVA